MQALDLLRYVLWKFLIEFTLIGLCKANSFEWISIGNETASMAGMYSRSKVKSHWDSLLCVNLIIPSNSYLIYSLHWKWTSFQRGGSRCPAPHQGCPFPSDTSLPSPSADQRQDGRLSGAERSGIWNCCETEKWCAVQLHWTGPHTSYVLRV